MLNMADSNERTLKEAFAKYDKDWSGYVDAKELEALVREVHPKITEESFKQIRNVSKKCQQRSPFYIGIWGYNLIVTIFEP